MIIITILRTFWKAIVAWYNDNAMRLGASVAYYSLFAIAPVLLVAIAVASSVFGEEAVRGHVAAQIDGMVGRDAAEAVEALIKGSPQVGTTAVAMVLGAITFILAACGVFLEIKAAFNTIWRVPPSTTSGVKDFFLNRVRAFGLVVAIGFLLLVSLVVGAALSAVDTYLASYAAVLPFILRAISIVLSLLVTTVLFGLMYKVLPDVSLKFRDVAVGATVTAILFTLGQTLIGLYLGRSATASSYGAAGSIIVLLLWVYYSSQIVLIGAEFTRLYAEQGERRPETTLTPPEPGTAAAAAKGA